MYKPKRFCIRGHDTWQVGRTSQHACKACKAIYNLTHKPSKTQRNEYCKQYRKQQREKERQLLIKTTAVMIENQLQIYPEDRKKASLAAAVSVLRILKGEEYAQA